MMVSDDIDAVMQKWHRPVGCINARQYHQTLKTGSEGPVFIV